MGERAYMSRRKVLIVSAALVCGGAERLAWLILQHLDRQRFEPILVVLSGLNDSFPEPEGNKVIYLHKGNFLDLPRIVWRLSRVYQEEQPDVVLSIVDYANLVSVLARKLSHAKPKLVLDERSHSSINLKYEFLGRLKIWAIPRLYPEADVVVCCSNGVADDLINRFNIPHRMIKVIQNPADGDYISEMAREEFDHPWLTSREMPVIIAAGRLVVQKNYPLMLRAFARVNCSLPCRLIILGDGKERESLLKLASGIGLNGKIDFLGFQKNPYKYMARSDIFVLSSLTEGLPWVILEAMTCGIPVISTRCPSGPDEIITDGINGLLVPVDDETALSEAILRLLNDKDFSAGIARAGRKRSEDFKVSEIISEYEAVL